MNQTHVIDPEALGSDPITVKLCDSCKDSFYQAMRGARISPVYDQKFRVVQFGVILVSMVLEFLAGFLFHAFLPVVSK